MKIKKESIAENSYHGVTLKTCPLEFGLLDKLLYDFNNFKFCTLIHDGKQEVFLEFSPDKESALKKHEEYHERLSLRPVQWYDVKGKKFKYVSYTEPAKAQEPQPPLHEEEPNVVTEK